MAELFQMSDISHPGTKDKKSRIMVLVILLFLVVGIGILMTVSYFYNNRCFNSYGVESRIARGDSNSAAYRYFRGNLLKYSRNGISALTNTGKSLWNGGYEMKQPQIDTCGEYVVVADAAGKQFYVYNGKDEGKEMETALPLKRAKVSEQGIVAALLQDSDSNVLNLYNPYSSTESLLVEIPTNVDEEGYPLDFDISPDGNSIVAAYMTVSGVKMENRVSFYNFTAVGQDKNTLVGGKSFGEKTISGIEFLGEDEAAVFYENGFSVFTEMKQPKVLFEKEFSEAIRSVAYDEDHIAVVTEGPDDSEKRVLRVFSARGREVMSRTVSGEYSDMKLYGDEIIFSGSHHCNIIRINGHDKLDCEFEDGADAISPTGNSNVYTLIGIDSIEKIKLEMK